MKSKHLKVYNNFPHQTTIGCIQTHFFFFCSDQVRSDIQFLERHEGESVVLPCVVEQRNPSPFGVYLKRSWLHHTEVLFMYTKSEFKVKNVEDINRTSVSGDPSSHALNVTISQLRASDTDRYYCEFVVEEPSSEDLLLPGKTEFFLLVSAGEFFCFFLPISYTYCSTVCSPLVA